jgi:hypothetical protein
VNVASPPELPVCSWNPVRVMMVALFGGSAPDWVRPTCSLRAIPTAACHPAAGVFSSCWWKSPVMTDMPL